MRIVGSVFPAVVLAVWLVPGEAATRRNGDAARLAAADLLVQSRAAYGALQAYADSGSVSKEASGFVDRFTFRTRFRRPADFYFEFDNGVSVGASSGLSVPLASHLVFWKLGPDLQTWHEPSQTHLEFPAGRANQVSPIAAANAGTLETAVLIPSLLFPTAGFVSTLQEITELTVAGTEEVGGQPCHKLMGIARSVYPSGQVFNVRPVTIWLDARTLLIRRVFTDTPKGYPRGAISRGTITLYPEANPTLRDADFSYTVPPAQQ